MFSFALVEVLCGQHFAGFALSLIEGGRSIVVRQQMQGPKLGFAFFGNCFTAEMRKPAQIALAGILNPASWFGLG